MSDIGSGPGWSETQWQKVNNAVTDEFARASVVSRFLTSYGPLSGSAESVRDERIRQTEDSSAIKLRITVDDDDTIKLATLAVRVELSNQQVADESLTSAVLAFRRAANLLALNHDDIVFNGYDDPDADEARRVPREDTEANKVVTNHPGDITGFLEVVERREKEDRWNEDLAAARTTHPTGTKEEIWDAARASYEKRGRGPAGGSTNGGEVVEAVAKAIAALEKRSSPGPFACVLGHDAFVAVHKPEKSMVQPAERLLPLLDGGPLLRSGRMPADRGIVVSLAAGTIDIVIGTPPRVQFLQMNMDAKSVFRVYMRFAFRIKDFTSPPVEVLRFKS